MLVKRPAQYPYLFMYQVLGIVVSDGPLGPSPLYLHQQFLAKQLNLVRVANQSAAKVSM